MNFIIVPWHNKEVKEAFVDAWKINFTEKYLLFEQDVDKIGCANMKNKMIQKAYDMGAEYIGVLDSDCHPVDNMNLRDWMDLHIEALEPQPVEVFEIITDPLSRGTPYTSDDRKIVMPVAGSIGFWSQNGDYDAASQLVYQNKPMTFKRHTIYGKYFALSGMNFAFKREWWSWPKLIDISRWDDIFMGWIWQKKAYYEGYCFNLAGPIVEHSRQSNPYVNLKIESLYIEEAQTLWRKIMKHPTINYNELIGFIPKK